MEHKIKNTFKQRVKKQFRHTALHNRSNFMKKVILFNRIRHSVYIGVQAQIPPAAGPENEDDASRIRRTLTSGNTYQYTCKLLESLLMRTINGYGGLVLSSNHSFTKFVINAFGLELFKRTNS